jgi:glyoxylase-like metal-dependent hydrolase (beta-lactamase superfamily II)
MQEYEVYAIKYASRHRLARENFLGGEPSDDPMPLDFYVWAIVGDGQMIVVDTGFPVSLSEKRTTPITRPVEAGLRDIGVDPNDVKTVILTHMHFDHAGNIDLFPNARFHLQKTELAFCTGHLMAHPIFRLVYNVEDVAAILRKLYGEQVELHDDGDAVAEGIDLHLLGGHTDGLQAVRVMTKRGWIVLASDTAPFYAHVEQRRPFSLISSFGAALDAYPRLLKLAGDLRHIVPGHDPLVLKRFPAAGSGVMDIARVDLAPTGWD